ncbi:MAG TPA: hypothetical protein VL242_32105 [Sorangium sp.]|nr:hypothetical protein [Sorangium sp.]
MENLPPEMQGSTQVVASRHVKTNDDERQRLKRAKLLAFERLLPGVNAMCLTDGVAHYVAWSTDSIVPTHPIKGVISNCSDCAGLSTFIWSNKEWPLARVDQYEVADAFLARSGPFVRSEVARFFVSTTILETEEQFVRGNGVGYSAQRAYAAAVLAAGRVGLPLTPDSRTRLLAILETNTGAAVADQIFRATSAIHWEHLFLDLYRCIERLYAIPYVRLARDRILALQPSGQVALSTPDLEDLLIDALGWRPKEMNALVEVLHKCQPGTVAMVLNVLAPSQRGLDDVPQLAKMIYEIRNDCAHFRGGKRRGRFHGNWEVLIEGIVELINDALSAYGSDL